MNNPFMAHLKNDSRAALIKSVVSTVFFIAIYYFFNRDSLTILVASIFIGAIYGLGLLDAVKEKQKLLMIVPATQEQLIKALFTLAIQSITIIALLIAPFYFLAAAFDAYQTPISETISIYIIVIGATFLFNALFIWLFFFMQEKTWLSLIQLATLLVVTLVSLMLSTILDRIGIHAIVQCIVFMILFSSSVLYVYKRTIGEYKKFNLL